MRFYYSSRLLLGSIIGIYYGEKRLPFPVQYIAKQNEVGDIKLDLSVVNAIVKDVKRMLPNAK